MRDWNVARAMWDGPASGTSFQHAHWLGAWYAAFDDVSPLIAIVSETSTQRRIALVPLILRKHRGVRIVEFADLGLTDYNAPIVGPAAPAEPRAQRALCRALLNSLRRLPERPDLVRLQKMPAEIGGRPNPLVAAGRIGSCSLNGNLIRTGDDFEAYRNSIKRMQLPRSWRVFKRYPGAAFRLIVDRHEALQMLDVTDAQQEARMQALGVEFNLNDDRRGRFYRDLISRGLEEGYAVVSALSCDEAVIATALGIRHGNAFVFLRISNAGRQWSHCSPRRLIIEQTMAALHGQGVREFDLSIGNYVFKRRFGATPLPLTDVSIAMSWRGVPLVLRDRAAQSLRRYPVLAERVARMLGRARPREDN